MLNEESKSGYFGQGYNFLEGSHVRDCGTDQLMRDVVLKNQVVAGTVNADPTAFHDAIRDLGEFRKRWPEAIRNVITGRHRIDAFHDILVGPAQGIKNVVAFD